VPAEDFDLELGELVAGLPADATSVTGCQTNGRRITIQVISRADLPVLDRLLPAALTVHAESSAEGRS
jgi:hypothetical protein